MKNKGSSGLPNPNKVILALICSLLVGPGSRVSANKENSDDTIKLEIVPDKGPYRPGTPLNAKLLITNNEDEDVYLFRGINQCSSQIGALYLVILDDKDREPASQRCSADRLMGEADVVQILRNQDSGILLKRNSIYGTLRTIQLPAKRGSYRLQAQLVPAGFTDEQNNDLEQHHIRVLRKTLSAPIITIIVK